MSQIWIGIDPGEKRIGLARSDALGLSARPWTIAQNLAQVVRLIGEVELEVAGIIVGLPRNMDGSYGPLARRSYEFIEKLRGEIDLTCRLWDERLTTQEAQKMRQLRSIQKSREIDAEAAAILLQSYLEAGTPDTPDPPELTEPAS